MTQETEYKVRGNPISINYNSKTHEATISSPALNVSQDMSLEDQLQNIGVYTRVDSVSEIVSPTEVTVVLKPAASVELRDENGTLVKRPVSNQFEGSTIAKRRNHFRYLATVDVETLRECGFEHKDDISLSLRLSEDGFLSFVATKESAPHSTVLRVESTGLLRIPNVIGAIADLDGHGIQWEVRGESLYGVTTYKIPEKEKQNIEGYTFTTTVTRVSQESVKRDGEEWSQERFQTHLHKKAVTELGWEENQYVDITFVDLSGVLALQFSGEIRSSLTEDAPCVKRLYKFGNDQFNIYLPNALVYTFGVDGGELSWNVDVSEQVLLAF